MAIGFYTPGAIQPFPASLIRFRPAFAARFRFHERAAAIQKVPTAKLRLFLKRHCLTPERCDALLDRIDAARRPSILSDPNRNARYSTSETCDFAHLELRLEDRAGLSQQTLLLNYASRRATIRAGTLGQPDVYNLYNVGRTLQFSLSVKFSSVPVVRWLRAARRAPFQQSAIRGAERLPHLASPTSPIEAWPGPEPDRLAQRRYPQPSPA